MRPTLFNYIVTREEFTTYTEELFRFILDGKLDIKIHDTYPLEDIRRVHEDLEARKTTGKVLIKI
jgi:NADPH2:quinone reductase